MSTTGSCTSTIVSRVDSVSPRPLPVRACSQKRPHVLVSSSATVPVPVPVTATAVPPPLPLTSPPVHRFPGLALGLDKTDVDFIHNILQRTHGEHRVWNRITALKEAYIRATSNKRDQPKKSKVSLVHALSNNDEQKDEKKKTKNKKDMAMKHSLAATKIRAELEKYDELPASSATVLDDDDYYYDDAVCSMTQRHPSTVHHRSIATLEQTSSTVHRLFKFMTAIKRRAQSNVQQLQRNLQDIRSRVQHESISPSMPVVDLQHHSSLSVRQRAAIQVDSIDMSIVDVDLFVCLFLFFFSHLHSYSRNHQDHV
jgi:hypothetical protein